MERSTAGPPAAGVQGFPVVLTSFVGRARALRETGDLLAGYRLVTVTGPGGVGKTRLAGEAARQVADRFADGACLVELAPVPDPAQVPAAMTAALGVRPPPGRPATEALTRVLARRQLLVVLDNCEHVIGAAAELCGALLRACDDLRILATSREALRIAGEAVYRLAPLPVPDLGAGDAAAAVGGVEAVALFADRARAADAGFALTRANRDDVTRLVGRLDGMPLAIELAAARVAALGLGPLLGELDGRLALLSGGDRLAAGRHRSLAAVAEWSYRLLNEDEQRVFRWLSVFPAPFTLAAAEAVAGQDAAPAVLHLVECSLLFPPQPGPDGRLRYSMQQVLRSYGLGLLAGSGEQAQAEADLARYALQVAEDAAAGLRTIDREADAARWLGAEEAALGAVLAWAVEHDVDAAVRLAAALTWWWRLRGRLIGQRRLIHELAGRAEPGSVEWCTLQYALGGVLLSTGDLAGAMEHCAAMVAVIGDQEPTPALVDVLNIRSVALSNLDQVPEGYQCARRALTLARELGYASGAAEALKNLAIAASYGDDMNHALEMARQATLLQNIPGGSARAGSKMLAGVLVLTGDFVGAEQVCVATLASARAAGHLSIVDALLAILVQTDQLSGRLTDAAAHLYESVQLMLRIGDWIELSNILDGCGHLCVGTGRFADAVTAWAARASFAEGMADAAWLALRREVALRKASQALGPDRTRQATQRGAVMSRATVADFVLMLTAPDPLPSAGQTVPGNLSARERELVVLVAQGRTDAEIAAQLYISIRTVRSHLDRIRDKTGCRRRADLTRLALSTGLL